MNQQKLTMIDMHTYPLAGYHKEEAIIYFSSLLKPYSYIIDQIQNALLLHNLPLYFLTLFLGTVLIYLMYIIHFTDFPSFLFLIALIVLSEIFFMFGGGSIIKNMFVELSPSQWDPPNPDRLRTIEEIVSLGFYPTLIIWRTLFFAYKSIIKPNLIDSIILLIGLAVVGSFFCVIRPLTVFAIGFYGVMIVPALLTRRIVYNFLMAHLGHPIPLQFESNDSSKDNVQDMNVHEKIE